MKSALCVLLLLSASALGQSNPVPFVNQPLVPSSASPGGAAFTLTVNGTGFVSGAVVNWNGTGLTTMFVSSSQLTVTVPASDIANATTASVTVTNPAPGGGTSNGQLFDVLAPVTSLTFTAFTTPTASLGIGVVTADFNGDGKPDLAYVDGNYANMIFVQLGNGDGTFQSPVGYAVGNNASHLVVADFNNDGKPDLAVANGGDNTIGILLGKGDGTFQPQATFSTASGPYDLVAGDLNGDGKLDLAVVAGGGISVLLGNGDGTFQGHVDYDTAVNTEGIVIGDFNRDGKLDLAVLVFDSSSTSGGVSFVQGNGDGTFQPAVLITGFTNQRNPFQVFAVDLNGDDKLDLVAVGGGCGPCHSDPVAATVLLGNGDGTFQVPVDYPNLFGGFDQGISSSVMGDFNADGKLDFGYTVTGPGGGLAMLLGNGDGTFQSGIIFPNITAYTEPGGLAAGDLEGDGNLDFVSTASNGSAFSLLVFLHGQQPLVTLSTTSLTQGPLPIYVGETTSMVPTLTVTNIGSSPLTISSVSFTGANVQDFSQNSNCIGNLVPNASCQINTTFAPVEGGNLTATLNIFDNARSSPQTVSVAGSGADFSVSPSSQTQTVSPGQIATYPVTVGPEGGFNQTVQLGCTGAPAESSCSLSPSSVTLNGTASQAVTVTVTTVGSSASMPNPQLGPPSSIPSGSWLWWLGTLGLLGLLSLAGWRRQWSRRWVYGVASVCLVCIGLTMFACGGGSNSGGGGNGGGGTSAGTYTLTLTGTFTSGATTLTHAAKLTLVVN